MSNIEHNYQAARQAYAAIGVDTDQALERLARLSLSMQCWQGDDVRGFESRDGCEPGGGLAVTGDHAGRARNADELRQDATKAFALIPGRHRFNLHAIYAEPGSGRHVERDALEPAHFHNWIDWARELGIGLDFNPTCFGHTMAAEGFTLSSNRPDICDFWVRHCQACRHIALAMGKALESPSVCNVWIPDGYKDTPHDRQRPRGRLQAALDRIFEEKMDPRWMKDAVEPKLFGIGSESYVVGSHEFYLAYAASRGTMLCLDAGHYHPTESIADKLSALLLFMDEILLHVSRGVRWDSDHVVTFTDDLQAICAEIVRGHFDQRVHIGLDYFDASINRVAAWVIGMRSTLKALLKALLEPHLQLQTCEAEGDFTQRLYLQQLTATLPLGDVWDYHCLRQDVPPERAWFQELQAYEQQILDQRY